MSGQLSHFAAGQPTPGITPRRVTLALLVLPPLIALMLLAYATLAHHPRPVHTGDALLDAYLQALADSDEDLTIQSHWLYPIKNMIPPANWKEWELQYGKDPHFWMLYYYGRLYERVYGKVPPSHNTSDVSFLRAARARGAADWVVLLTLVRHEASDWNESARKTLALASPGYNATQQERERFDALIWAEVTRVHGTELAQLMDELRRSGADQAQAHYYLAQIACERGDMSGALSELAAGNAALHNDAGLGLPFDALAAAARQGQPLAGDSVISGQLKLGYDSFRFHSFRRYKHLVQSVSAWAVRQRDISALQVLHRCCCRYGVSEGAGPLQAEVAAGMEATVLDSVQQFTYGTATVRGQVLSQAQAQHRTINTALHSLDISRLSITWPSAWDIVFESAPAVSYGGRYLMLDMLRGYSRDLISEQTALAGPVRQQFEALAAIDFTR
jgi:hypothetical protein